MKIAVVGLGNMGQALVRGFIREEIVPTDSLLYFEPDTEKVRLFAESNGGQVCSDYEALSHADYILLAVKPQIFDMVLTQLNPFLREDATLISIAASVSISRIRSLTGEKRPVIRVMPNTPALVSTGVSAICFDHVPSENMEFVKRLFESCGMVYICSEIQLDAVGNVSGTGPAYLMLFMEALADAAVKLGIPRDKALEISAATLYGSGKLAMETGLHPAILKDQVCSPGGMTIEGIIALEKAGLRAAVLSAVEAADEKTKMLAGNGRTCGK